MIDPLKLTLCSYFANALEFDILLIQLNNTWSFSWLFAILFCGIEETGNLIFFSKCTFIKLSNDIWFVVFSFKMARIRIFSPRTPAKARSNLKCMTICKRNRTFRRDQKALIPIGATLIRFTVFWHSFTHSFTVLWRFHITKSVFVLFCFVLDVYLFGESKNRRLWSVEIELTS